MATPNATSFSWLTAAQATEYLGLASTAALYKRVERGQVPARRWGRQFRFRRTELDALMAPSHASSGLSGEVGCAPVSAVVGGESR